MSKSDVKRVVCFTPEKHHKYMSAAALESPVKITGANLSPGKNNTVEVLCGKRSSIEIVTKELAFKKQKTEHHETVAEVKTLEDLKEENVNVSFFLCIFITKTGINNSHQISANIFLVRFSLKVKSKGRRTELLILFKCTRIVKQYVYVFVSSISF